VIKWSLDKETALLALLNSQLLKVVPYLYLCYLQGSLCTPRCVNDLTYYSRNDRSVDK
jgi:hypothetical protein